MSRDDITRMAQESGGHQGDECEQCGETHPLWIFGTEELECFAALVAERETALLRQALDCLENHVMQRTYASGVVICNTAIALRERLGEKT
jgi:hypothetical protein